MRYIPLPDAAHKGYLIGDRPSYVSMVAEQTRYRAEMGLNPEQIIIVPGVGTPLFLGHVADHFRDKWPGLNAKMAWHPLLWLPGELLYTRDIEEGGVVREMSQMEWAANIAMNCEMLRGCEFDDYSLIPKWELQTPLVKRKKDKDNFGVDIPHYEEYDYNVEDDVFFRRKNPGENLPIPLYNNLDGSWLDVLSLVNIDVFTPEGEARVDRWLKGASDPDLDNLSVAPLLNIPGLDPAWAIKLLSRPCLQQLGETIDETTPTYCQMIERAGAYPIAKDALHAFNQASKMMSVNLEGAKRVIKSWAEVVDFYCSPGPEFSALTSRTVTGVVGATSPEQLEEVIAPLKDAFNILYRGIEQDAVDFSEWFITFYDETYFHMVYVDGAE